MLSHPTISAWQRQEDGSYAAEIRGWKLRVRWVPERPGQHRGFLWEAQGPTGARLSSREVDEEIEVAMATAEELVAPNPEKHESKVID
jgi:hypothetical protein